MNWERGFILFVLLLIVPALVVSGGYSSGDEAGPELMPRFWIVLLLAAAIPLLWRKTVVPNKPVKVISAQFWWVLSALAVYLWMLPSCGYFLSSLLFIPAFFALTGQWKAGLPAAVVWVFFAFVLFYQLLGIQLPVNPLLESWLY